MQRRKIYYWIGQTVRQDFNTGIQRVVRCLGQSLFALGIELIPVRWDDDAGRVIVPSREELNHLAKWGGPILRSYPDVPEMRRGEWMLLPEIPLPSENRHGNPILWAKDHGLFAATVFFDMIPIKQRSMYPTDIVKYFEHFIQGMAEADLILPISETVRADLCGYMAQCAKQIPPAKTCLLSGEVPGRPRSFRVRARDRDEPLRLLAIGTWEPRKNYVRLMRAVERARHKTDVQLTIVGRHTRHEFPAFYQNMVETASRVGPSVVLRDFVEDSQMENLIASAHAMIYGSCEEGFGLPVVESLWNGLPCLCHNASALAEIAPGGGTMMVDMSKVDTIAQGIVQMASDRKLYSTLATEVTLRPLRMWGDYGADVLEALDKHHESIPISCNPFGH